MDVRAALKTQTNSGTCSGKVAIVTGAAGSGMGRSIALTLAREGAKRPRLRGHKTGPPKDFWQIAAPDA